MMSQDQSKMIEQQIKQTRRQFITSGKHLLGGAALAALMGQSGFAKGSAAPKELGAVQRHFTPKAKRVIYLHMVGGPSQMDLFDYKTDHEGLV